MDDRSRRINSALARADAERVHGIIKRLVQIITGMTVDIDSGEALAVALPLDEREGLMDVVRVNAARFAAALKRLVDRTGKKMSVPCVRAAAGALADFLRPVAALYPSLAQLAQAWAMHAELAAFC
jgi:hypothetical protein